MNKKKIDKRNRKLELKAKKREEALKRRQEKIKLKEERRTNARVNKVRFLQEKEKIRKAWEVAKGETYIERRGVHGESVVTNTLQKLVKAKQGFFINNVHVRDPLTHHWNQIDHVYIDQSGIYVIETKRWAGYIFGTESDRYWTQVKSEGRVKQKLPSPFLQNMRHLDALRRFLNLPFQFFTCSIIMTGECYLSHVKSDCVHSLLGFRRQVLRNKSSIISQKQCEEIYLKLKKYNDHVDASKEECIKNLKRK